MSSLKPSESTCGRFALKSLVRGGRIVTCGATSGDQPSADLCLIFVQQLQIFGSTLLSASVVSGVAASKPQGRGEVATSIPLRRSLTPGTLVRINALVEEIVHERASIAETALARSKAIQPDPNTLPIRSAARPHRSRSSR